MARSVGWPGQWPCTVVIHKKIVRSKNVLVDPPAKVACVDSYY
jgi:hypothetical protein